MSDWGLEKDMGTRVVCAKRVKATSQRKDTRKRRQQVGWEGAMPSSWLPKIDNFPEKSYYPMAVLRWSGGGSRISQGTLRVRTWN